MDKTTPTAEELATAPVIDDWELRRAVLSRDRQQLHGTFRGHPEIADGERGHSSDVIQLDGAEPPRWALCASRIYRLGNRK
ncbi:DUF6634 family protein [Agrobacterium sp. 22094]|uniref:DUF6634 family protein n=1 Tax=Agrobacterium sp. 22094 TaxID=3453872 RepID=UPI003F8470B8